LRKGEKFTTTMTAKDGSMRFDFAGIYDRVIENKHIDYTMEDGRKVLINFSSYSTQTHIMETFELEAQNPEEMQRDGWQAILNNFKKHTEEN
jgi:uncharacterized protein YndB with AHSA1/START domain